MQNLSNELMKPIENDGSGLYWKVQDAIQAYKEHVATRQALPYVHDHWTREFVTQFKDKNIAEIPPAEIEGFLFAIWGESERSTWNKAKARVNGFYSFVIRELKRQGSPSFHNPCSLIDDLKEVKRKKHEFIRIDKMKELLDTFTKPSHWLWFHILVTAGLRISELTELRPMDVSGRVLTLGGGAPCKSGRPFGEEQAVIPQPVADRLKVYMNGMRDDERIFKTAHTNIWAILKRRCKLIRADEMSPHDLREWCSSFWDENNDPSMTHFILRPTLEPRSAKYLTELSIHEAMARQDLIMVPVLIGDSPTGYTHTYDFYQATDSKPTPKTVEPITAFSQNQETSEKAGGDKPFPYGDGQNEPLDRNPPRPYEDQIQDISSNKVVVPYKKPEVYSSPSTWDTNIYPVPPFHQTLLAHELTLKRASNDLRKLEASLSSAMVDLNPHQIDAALFAFKGPMSNGALLCDEVGLGKTIEAGLIISQLWAEGRRRIIAVVPATIRKQWQNELLEKFGIPCVIVDGFEYKSSRRNGIKNPFDRGELVIVSIPFASMKAQEIAAAGKWDLVVIDEAHRLRNVYRKSGSKQAKRLKEIFAGQPKILLTATPLQNSLMELYDLVSFIDDRLFGSEYAFRTHFVADSSGHETNNLEALKRRLAEVVTRTIRRQVREYIPYTNRISMVEDFTPTDAEFDLYERVSEYLQRPELVAIPHRQRHLMILIYRKILASSSFAIAGTLQKLVDNVERQIKGLEPEPIDELIEDVDGFEEEKEELAKTENGEPLDEEDKAEAEKLRRFSLDVIRAERDELLSMKTLAESIHKNAKGDALLIALENAFSKVGKTGWGEKAVIFTESRRTQEYLLRLLSENGYRDRITIFNGSNEGPIAKRAYAIWENERPRFEGEIVPSRTAAIREALIHEFKLHTKILIATEAGAEGINLQFCNIVINYDLPWNPQRVEQRIGRCHRYGQKNDVVAMNFLNTSNAADMRVFELLDIKFRLFSGVFGASDEILGAIGSGIDFERRILDIYQSCRTAEEINTAFDKLQAELSEEINQRILETRSKLLEHFDDEVRARFKVINSKMKEDIGTLDTMLARLVISALDVRDYKIESGVCRMFIGQNEAMGEDKTGGDKPRPYENQHSINAVGEALVASRIGIGQNERQAWRGQAPPIQPQLTIQHGWYYIGRHSESANAERLHAGHPISKNIIESIKKIPQELHAVRLCYTKGGHRITTMEPYLGKTGAWFAYRLFFEGLDTEEHLVHIVCAKDGNGWTILDNELTQKLPTITAEYMENGFTSLPPEGIVEQALSEIQQVLEEKIGVRNEEYYESELDKLDLYSDEVLMEFSDELRKKEAELSDAKKRKLRVQSFEDKTKARKEILNIEKECGNITEKLAQEKRRLFEEKEKEAKMLEKKLKLKVQRTCVAKAVWEMI